VSGIWSMLIDEKSDGACRVHDVASGKSWWRRHYDECWEIAKGLDEWREPGFGVLQPGAKVKRGKRKAKEDPTPWMSNEVMPWECE